MLLEPTGSSKSAIGISPVLGIDVVTRGPVPGPGVPCRDSIAESDDNSQLCVLHRTVLFQRVD